MGKTSKGGALVNHILNQLNYFDYLYDPENNLKFKVRFNDLISKAIIRHGNYEPRSLGFALRLLKARPGVFIDLGANFGLYTIYAAKTAGVETIAVEGSPMAFSQLKTNIELNNLQDYITQYNVVVSSENKFVSFGCRHAGNLGSSGIGHKSMFHDNSEFQVYTTTLDAIWIHSNLLNKQISLIKIDLEGHEYELLNSAILIWQKKPAYLLIEKNPGSPREIITLLESRGYRCFTLNGEAYSADAEIPENNLLFLDIDKIDTLNSDIESIISLNCDQ